MLQEMLSKAAQMGAEKAIRSLYLSVKELSKLTGISYYKLLDIISLAKRDGKLPIRNTYQYTLAEIEAILPIYL